MSEQPSNARVLNKFFSELADILSEKYGYDITMRVIPKPKEGAENESKKQKSA